MRIIQIAFTIPIFTAALLFSDSPPDWARDAIWYQIFPERFYNGDPSNDPTIESLIGTWPWDVQTEWQVSPWTSDWYEYQPWEKANGQLYNYQFQIRRYGGDIQGIIDKLDYLQELGINAIYLNPVFDSPSSHKYGASYYHHIDRHFGPDPEGDASLMAEEDPADPSTWQWTAADKLFLQLIRDIHDRNMHIIIDGVFNHVGLTFWAFQDVINRGTDSPYYTWFGIEGSGLSDLSHLNDYQTLPELYQKEDRPPLRYTGYVADLPAFRQDEYGPVEPVRNHLEAVVARWMDPNGDGNPDDGVDGWRLDVAERIQIKFWDRFGSWVRQHNPQAYITGEIWWEDYWNNKQFNAAPWLSDDRLDAVMNYRFGNAMFQFFIDEKLAVSPSRLDLMLAEVRTDYPPETAYVLQNLFDSHDMERLASSVVNPDRWMDHANNLQYNLEFDIRKPKATERQVQKAIIAFQFAYLGAPFIYYGDEAGMWGADDPDCRKPMLWPEFSYDSEVAHPCDYRDDCTYTRPVDTVAFDSTMFQFYQDLIALRQKHPALRRGTYATVFTDDKKGLFAFRRQSEDETILAVFNQYTRTKRLPRTLFPGGRSRWELIYPVPGHSTSIDGKSFQFYLAR